MTKRPTEASGGGTIPTPFNITEFLGSVVADIDGALEAAEALVETKRSELAEAEKNLSMLKGLQGLHNGTMQLVPISSTAVAKAPRKANTSGAGSSGGRASSGPRGEVPKAVHDLVQKAGANGVSRAEILKKLQIGDADKAGQTSVSNALSAGKRKGVYKHHVDGRYSLMG